jgi:uncharacterized SAM-binding protein YcdF (DUF218 family)
MGLLSILLGLAGLGIIASAIMLGFGMLWLMRAATKARLAGEEFGVLHDGGGLTRVGVDLYRATAAPI